ncbi:996_t:CDS:2 [Acaulospora colombiana]|uniref:996_t:CDS:1 n=1 Tax=Acaulospora colombiana TaxID=27376 RepID=A0ACA9MXB5_9GLOM|nr:996_t:CDS:2 [Acaulospora colombiana]
MAIFISTEGSSGGFPLAMDPEPSLGDQAEGVVRPAVKECTQSGPRSRGEKPGLWNDKDDEKNASKLDARGFLKAGHRLVFFTKGSSGDVKFWQNRAQHTILWSRRTFLHTLRLSRGRRRGGMDEIGRRDVQE